MGYQVYRLRTFDEGSNAYTTARSEQWVLAKDVEFEEEEKAKNYIVEQSFKHTDLPIFLQQWKEDIASKKQRQTQQQSSGSTQTPEMVENQDQENDDDDAIIQRREQIIDMFLFSDPRYLKYRRFFLHPPPDFKALSASLRESGIKMVKSDS